VTERIPNEARPVDRSSRRTPATQRDVFMELWQARCVQGYVAVHLHSKINLGDLAKVAQFSRCKFNRTFKASFGCTPGQYVRRMRVARAQNLMTVSGDPLCQIAMESGFADQSHFNRCFRKVVGESPTIWRAALQEFAKDLGRCARVTRSGPSAPQQTVSRYRRAAPAGGGGATPPRGSEANPSSQRASTNDGCFAASRKNWIAERLAALRSNESS